MIIQEAPCQRVVAAAPSARPPGMVLKLECGHRRFIGGIEHAAKLSQPLGIPIAWRCLQCVVGGEL